MAYVTVSQISSEFKNIDFSSSTSVTSTEVSEFIDQEESVINLTISNRYEVPVLGAESINILSRIAIAFTAYRVAKILNLKKDIPIPEKLVAQDLSDGAFYLTAKKQLDKIRDGEIVLTDAEARSLGQGIESFNRSEVVDPLWKRDLRQW